MVGGGDSTGHVNAKNMPGECVFFDTPRAPRRDDSAAPGIPWRPCFFAIRTSKNYPVGNGAERLCRCFAKKAPPAERLPPSCPVRGTSIYWHACCLVFPAAAGGEICPGAYSDLTRPQGGGKSRANVKNHREGRKRSENLLKWRFFRDAFLSPAGFGTGRI